MPPHFIIRTTSPDNDELDGFAVITVTESLLDDLQELNYALGAAKGVRSKISNVEEVFDGSITFFPYVEHYREVIDMVEARYTDGAAFGGQLGLIIFDGDLPFDTYYQIPAHHVQLIITQTTGAGLPHVYWQLIASLKLPSEVFTALIPLPLFTAAYDGYAPFPVDFKLPVLPSPIREPEPFTWLSVHAANELASEVDMDSDFVGLARSAGAEVQQLRGELVYYFDNAWQFQIRLPGGLPLATWLNDVGEKWCDVAGLVDMTVRVQEGLKGVEVQLANVNIVDLVTYECAECEQRVLKHQAESSPCGSLHTGCINEHISHCDICRSQFT